MGIEAKIQDLEQKRASLMEGGGKDRIEKQHQGGKLTARERIARLIDGGSFQEIGLFAKHHATLFGMADKELPADGVVTGAANVDGRLIHLASQDFTVGGGAAGEVHSEKVAEMMRYSLKRAPPSSSSTIRAAPECRRHQQPGRLRPGLLHERNAFRSGTADFADLRTLRGRSGV